MVNLCTRCILPETFPGIKFDEKGTCNYCNKFERYWGEWIRSEELKAESRKSLFKIFEWAKGKKKKYDALVPISGGKDSSYALHLCKKVFALNVLTFTNSNGFHTDYAKENIAKMVKKLGLEHVYYEEPLMVDLARHFFLNTGNFCAPCMLGNFNSIHMIAEEYDIPLIVYASSSKTDAGFPKELNPWNPWYFKKVLKNDSISKQADSTFFGRNYLARSAIHRLRGKRKFILLPNYLEWNEEAAKELLEREYGLVFHGEHSDCMFTEVAAYLQKKRNSSVDAATMKYSLLIRNGLMDRETALQLVSASNNKPPEVLGLFLEKLNLTPKEFEEASQLSPAPYLKGISYILNRVRRIIRRQY